MRDLTELKTHIRPEALSWFPDGMQNGAKRRLKSVSSDLSPDIDRDGSVSFIGIDLRNCYSRPPNISEALPEDEEPPQTGSKKPKRVRQLMLNCVQIE